MKEKQNNNASMQDIASAYNKLYESTGTLRDSDALYKWILSKLKLKPSQKMLDIACGEGVLVKYAQRAGIDCIGIDIASNAIDIAKSKTNKSIYALANGEELPFRAQNFDALTNIGSLEHFKNPIRGINEMCRVLKPRGRAAILLPNSHYLVDIIWNVWRKGYSVSHNQPIEHFATYGEWSDLLQQGGFKVFDSYKYNFMFPKTFKDWCWYRQHPRKLLNLIVSPIIPFNLSNHFLYICIIKDS